MRAPDSAPVDFADMHGRAGGDRWCLTCRAELGSLTALHALTGADVVDFAEVRRLLGSAECAVRVTAPDAAPVANAMTAAGEFADIYGPAGDVPRRHPLWPLSHEEGIDARVTGCEDAMGPTCEHGQDMGRTRAVAAALMIRAAEADLVDFAEVRRSLRRLKHRPVGRRSVQWSCGRRCCRCRERTIGIRGDRWRLPWIPATDFVDFAEMGRTSRCHDRDASTDCGGWIVGGSRSWNQSGNLTENVVPASAEDVTSTVPPCARAI
ncbi:MAG TPA: hypothetical protein VFQ53_04165 [Kofleriaceae bacterium]|nr:hypothetical protein [Kofleriaceae bacterium]